MLHKPTVTALRQAFKDIAKDMASHREMKAEATESSVFTVDYTRNPPRHHCSHVAVTVSVKDTRSGLALDIVIPKGDKSLLDLSQCMLHALVKLRARLLALRTTDCEAG